jgi:hypothetical protein
VAYIRAYFRCPTCSKEYKTYDAAAECRGLHLITRNLWAIGENGKAVRVTERCVPGSYGSKEWALREADLRD